MLGVILSGLSGLYSSMFKHKASTSNTAKLNTPGYKAEPTEPPGGPDAAQPPTTSPTGPQSAFVPTSSPFNVAINGEGYFKVIDDEGRIAYTRVGDFVVDSQGFLATPDGFRLSPPVKVPPVVGAVRVTAQGAVEGINNETGQLEELGTFFLSRFANPDALQGIGNGKYLPTSDSGAPVWGVPGSGGLGTLVSGRLQEPNLDLAGEMANQAIAPGLTEAKGNQTADEAIGTTVDITE